LKADEETEGTERQVFLTACQYGDTTQRKSYEQFIHADGKRQKSLYPNSEVSGLDHDPSDSAQCLLFRPNREPKAIAQRAGKW